MAKILIVRNYSALIDILLIHLEEKKYELRTVISFAKMKAELPHFNADLILIDVMLYGETGRNIGKAIKASMEYIETPIILFSSSLEWVRDYKVWDADSIMEKPFDIKSLSLKIEKLLSVPTVNVTN